MGSQDSPPGQSPERAAALASDGGSGSGADAPGKNDGDKDGSSAAGAGDPGEDRDGERDRDGTGVGGRDVVVPMRVYKAVTVFTTLFAVATVVGGFVLLDSATDRATASLSEIDPLVALAGIGLIVAGAAAYAFSTRFRAAGMGKPKNDTDEPSDNG